MKFNRSAGLISCLLALSACGGRSASSGSNASGAADAGGSAGMASAGGNGATASNGGAASCAIDAPSAAEFSATPRANTNLELLALKFSNGMIADQAVYDRLVRDVALIVARDPNVTDIHYFAPHDGKELLLLTDDQQTLHDMQSGAYSAWNCLNETYGVSPTEFGGGATPYVALASGGIYNIPLLAEQYRALPKIRTAGPGIGGGDGPTICVTRGDDVWHYVFDRASGDCPAGCTEHQYFHFMVTSAGSVTTLGALTTAEAAIYASREACR